MLFYRLLGKRIVFTAHNVNAAKRDAHDSWLNRLTLRIQYRLCDHIFVHTERMKRELLDDFGVPDQKATVIPFGINNTVPNTALTTAQARARLGIGERDKTLLFFGNIAPYKGLEYLVSAFISLARKDANYRLIIAGRPKGSEDYWMRIHRTLSSSGLDDRIIERIEYVPDADTEFYFKAADVLILPYVYIFQSGVLFLAYNFGLPVIACNVGSLAEEIVDGETGLICQPRDAQSLRSKIEEYFSSHLYRAVGDARLRIQAHAQSRYSWARVSLISTNVYFEATHERK